MPDRTAEHQRSRSLTRSRPALITSADTARPRSTRSPPKLVTPRLSALPRQTSHDSPDLTARPSTTRHWSQRTASLYSSTPSHHFRILTVAQLGGNCRAHQADPEWWQARDRFVRDYPDEVSFVSQALAATELYFIEHAHSTGNMKLKDPAGKLREIHAEVSLLAVAEATVE
jgi:hypothetical protein